MHKYENFSRYQILLLSWPITDITHTLLIYIYAQTHFCLFFKTINKRPRLLVWLSILVIPVHAASLSLMIKPIPLDQRFLLPKQKHKLKSGKSVFDSYILTQLYLPIFWPTSASTDVNADTTCIPSWKYENNSQVFISSDNRKKLRGRKSRPYQWRLLPQREWFGQTIVYNNFFYLLDLGQMPQD